MKSQFLIILFISFTLCFSCASDQEQIAFDNIAEHFKAQVNFSKGFSSKNGQKTQNFIALRIRNSPYTKKIKSDQLSVYASTMLVKSLTEEELSEYTHIKANFLSGVEATDKQQDSINVYKIETLKNIANKSKGFFDTADALKNGKDADLYKMLGEKYRNPQEESSFEKAIANMKAERKGVLAIKLLGVEALVDKNTKEPYLGFNGEIKWGNYSTSLLHVRTFKNPKINDILFLNIK